MDVRFINPFITSCNLLFHRHLGMSVTLGKPRLKNAEKDRLEDYDVTISVDLSGSAEGRVKLHFTEAVALALAGGLSGTTHRTIDESTNDALREIANMIVGTAKREFPGELTRISIPKLITSQHDEWKHDRKVLSIPLQCMAGNMLLEVKIQSSQKSAKAKPAETSSVASSPDVDEDEVQEMVSRLLSAAGQ